MKICALTAFIFMSACLTRVTVAAVPFCPIPDLVATIERNTLAATNLYEISAGVVFSAQSSRAIIVSNDNAFAELFTERLEHIPKPGDTIRATVAVYNTTQGVQAHIWQLTILSHGIPPTPTDILIEDIPLSARRFELIRVVGDVVDAYADDIDEKVSYLSIASQKAVVYVPLNERMSREMMRRYVGARISVTGIIQRPSRLRPYHKHEIHTSGSENRVILKPAPSDPFDVPALRTDKTVMIDVPTVPRRRLVQGQVVAVWNKNFMLRTPYDDAVRAETIDGRLPGVGEPVEVVGLPDANAYNVNMRRSLWRPCAGAKTVTEDIENVTLRDLFFATNGLPRITPQRHGTTIRLRGTLCGLSDIDDGDACALLKDGNAFIVIHAGSAGGSIKDTPAGSVIEATGVCVVEVESWKPQTPAQHINEVFLVLRRESDWKIVSRPPWWTSGRLFALVLALSTGLIAFFSWNRHLKRRIELRSRELLDEQIAHISSELKTMERTRLAIELHDAISQNLAGVALELQTVHDTFSENGDVAAKHLAIASRSLTSCREELRNCLRDLRSEALEEQDLNTAIQMTLGPCADKARVAIRFNVPRDRLTDNTTHTLLRIIRELVFNAIHHGNASEVKVAGAIEDEALLFSVSDNGCGFDPDTSPGVSEGHYGLQGIRDRIERFKGTMKLNSKVGAGTKVTISIRLPHGEES